MTDITDYGYADAELNDSNGYLLPALRTELGRLPAASGPSQLTFERSSAGTYKEQNTLSSRDFCSGWTLRDFRATCRIHLRCPCPLLAKSMVAIARKPG